MKIKDQIMSILSFGLNDTTFDEYAEEFGVTLPEGDIINDIMLIESNENIQNALLDDLFMTIVRNCLEDYGIISPDDDITAEWLEKNGFSWEANGIASWLAFKGVRFTKKNEFYAAVYTAFSK